MATTQNAGDLQLAATYPRMESVSGTTTMDFANVTGSTKPQDNATKNIISYGALVYRPTGTNGDIYYATDTSPATEYMNISGNWVATSTTNTGLFAMLNGQINSSNYAAYLAENTISVLGFAQSQTQDSTSQYTSVSINSDNKNVVVIISARFAGNFLTTNGGYSYMNARLAVRGTTRYSGELARFANSSTSDYDQITTSIPVQVDSPGTGSVLYELYLSRVTTGNGWGGTIGWPTIQVIGLKV